MQLRTERSLTQRLVFFDFLQHLALGQAFCWQLVSVAHPLFQGAHTHRHVLQSLVQLLLNLFGENEKNVSFPEQYLLEQKLALSWRQNDQK